MKCLKQGTSKIGAAISSVLDVWYFVFSDLRVIVINKNLDGCDKSMPEATNVRKKRAESRVCNLKKQSGCNKRLLSRDFVSKKYGRTRV